MKMFSKGLNVVRRYVSGSSQRFKISYVGNRSGLPDDLVVRDGSFLLSGCTFSECCVSFVKLQLTTDSKRGHESVLGTSNDLGDVCSLILEHKKMISTVLGGRRPREDGKVHSEDGIVDLFLETYTDHDNCVYKFNLTFQIEHEMHPGMPVKRISLPVLLDDSNLSYCLDVCLDRVYLRRSDSRFMDESEYVLVSGGMKTFENIRGSCREKSTCFDIETVVQNLTNTVSSVGSIKGGLDGSEMVIKTETNSSDGRSVYVYTFIFRRPGMQSEMQFMIQRIDLLLAD